MNNVPKKIYLQVDPDDEQPKDFKECFEVSWCDERINDTDIEYILNTENTVDVSASPAVKSDVLHAVSHTQGEREQPQESQEDVAEALAFTSDLENLLIKLEKIEFDVEPEAFENGFEFCLSMIRGWKDRRERGTSEPCGG